MKRLLDAWNDYWFRPAPLINLAALRIIAVATQLYMFIRWNPTGGGEFARLVELKYLYMPIFVIRIMTLPFGWGSFPSLPTLTWIYWLTMTAGVLALVGLRTNVALALFAAGCVFLQGFAYSFQEMHHPEAIMMIALALLAISPCGRRLSLDDLLARIKAVNRRLKFESADLFATSPFAGWPLKMVAWTFSLIYLSAAYWKWRIGGADWMNGYTLQYYLLQDGLRWDIPVGIWLASQHTLAWVLGAGSLIFEAFFWLVLVFPKLAWVFAPMGFGLHAGIIITMKAGFFEYLALYAAFVPWAALILYLRRRAEARSEAPALVFDGHCYLCLRSMTVIDFFDWTGRVRFFDLEEEASLRRFSGISKEDARREIHLVLADGRIFKGFFAFRRLSWYMPAFWILLPLFYAPGASLAGPVIYDRVAKARKRFITCDTGTCDLHSTKPA